MNKGILCNDIHSRLNEVRVTEIHHPASTKEVAAIIQHAARMQQHISICGARHAMGGQQFGEDTLLLDASNLKSLGELDHKLGLVEAGAGLTWPELISELHTAQQGLSSVWTIRQKQTGADDLTLGGALAANIHGRGLRMKPIIDDVVAFTLVNASGEILRCSRTENADLFRHAIGGYGCFGIITSVLLRLTHRVKVERSVEITDMEHVIDTLESRICAGALYGDFQFSIDECSQDFLKRGVLSTYREVEEIRKMEPAAELGAEDWKELIHLAHTDRAKVFEVYSEHYLRTQGSLYWSDTHQLSVYLRDYHCHLDERLGSAPATEMITELYVPREYLVDFMRRSAEALRSSDVPVIYGTVRLIEQDRESALAWARERFACVIFNLHTPHDEGGIARSTNAFQILIDLALSYGGSYFLTYHRWAKRDQLERAHPYFREFLRTKKHYDPADRFQSDWWRYYRDLFTAP